MMSFLRTWNEYFNVQIPSPHGTAEDDQSSNKTKNETAGLPGDSQIPEDGSDSNPNPLRHEQPSTQGTGGNGSTSGRGDERDLRIEDLQAELEKTRKRCGDYRERYKEYKEKRDELRKKCDLYGEHCNAWKERHDESQKTCEVYARHCKKLEEQYNELRDSYDAVQALSDKQKVNIRELTVAISRSVNTNGTTTRDDDYFEAEFSSLEGAIHQWVFKCFRNVSISKRQDLTQTVLESLKATVYGDSTNPDSAMSLKEIEAVIAERLCTHIFRPSFVLTIQEKMYDLDYIFKVLGGSDLKKRELYAQMVGMILESDNYDDHLLYNIRNVENDLQDCSSILAKGGNEEQRRKILSTIVEKAAKLQVETFRQISPFQLYKIEPGDMYDRSFMEDKSGVVDEDEDGEGGRIFIVRIVLFPPVFRWEFDESGKQLENPVIVRKGTVIAIHPED